MCVLTCRVMINSLFIGDRVVSFHEQVHTRLLKMYSVCTSNLKGVNDSLSRLQDNLRVRIDVHSPDHNTGLMVLKANYQVEYRTCIRDVVVSQLFSLFTEGPCVS